jgi:hypothetical protein
MEWHHAIPPKKKARTKSLAGKILGRVLWDARRRILVDALPRKETLNVVHHVQILKKLWCELCDKCRMKATPFFNTIMQTLTLHTWHWGKLTSLAWQLQTTTCSGPLNII